jgi:hypothetical protein
MKYKDVTASTALQCIVSCPPAYVIVAGTPANEITPTFAVQMVIASATNYMVSTAGSVDAVVVSSAPEKRH